MNNEDLTVLILDKIGWDYDKILNPGHYKSTNDLYAGELIKAILNTTSTPEAAVCLGISYKTIITALARFFKPLFGNIHGGGATWRFRLLHEIEYKECGDCNKMLPYSEYHKDISSPRGIVNYCKDCRVVHNAQSYSKEETKKAHKRSHELHRHEIRERNARYRIERSQRVPKWSESEQIKEFYRNCPEGHHVDHKIPLKGELVSGLHVLSNLQYLTAEENMKKGNKYSPCGEIG